MFSVLPKLFLLLFSATNHTLALSASLLHKELKAGVLDACNCVVRDSFTSIWKRRTVFQNVYKIPLVHSGTGKRNSFPVIQDTHSHSIPDIMPLGSGCGKLWGGLFKGGAEVWACWRACLMGTQRSGFDQDTNHKDLHLGTLEFMRRLLQWSL